MARAVNVQIPEGTLRKAATRSNITQASKTELLRYALLRTVKSAEEAEEMVFGVPDDITEVNGVVAGQIPDHEYNMIKAEYPTLGLSEIARAGFAIASGEREARAWEMARMARGPKPRDSKDASQ